MADDSRTFIQHKWSYAIHIVYKQVGSGVYRTHCGKQCSPNSVFFPDLHGEREEDVVCFSCRSIEAGRCGKRIYEKPILRHGLSEAKRGKLQKALREYRDRQALEAWNKAVRG